jgi:membrane-associated phospholipid phosphatase
LKYAVGRARPDSGESPSQFNPFESDEKWHSFPSRHTAVMWAAVTPYAKEYGMEWLYGLALVTNAARTASREHWFSDTVAGSLLGYGLGHLAWEARRGNKNAPKVAIGPNNVALVWDLQ